MKLKHLALAALMSVTAPMAVNAATSYNYSDLQLSYSGDYRFGSGVATASAFWDILSSLANSNGYTSVYNYFDSVSHLGLDLAGFSDVIKIKTSRNDPTWSGNLKFDTDNLKISFLGADINGTGVGGSVTTTGGSTVPVPGPEAGAGLGALAMGGIALYMKRRRRDEALAA